MAERWGVLDGLKGLACVLIVWHHLAFYGPMSDAARPLAPELIDWLAEYGRIAVQVFLVTSGFLVARVFALGAATVSAPLSASRLIGRRYVRLVRPYAMALCAAMLAAALARRLMIDPSIPDPPQLAQLFAHLLLLQDLLGYDALSSGVWYVAIDFQLFVLSAFLCQLGRRLGHGLAPQAGRPGWRHGAPEVWLIAALTAASLLWFNRERQLDITAPYFAGAYGLGMLAGWAGRSRHPGRWLACIAALGLAALALEWRERIAVALCTALALGLLQAGGPLSRWRVPVWLESLGHRSYAIFLIHFPVCLVVNALWCRLWPAQPWVNALGLLLAFALSLWAGAGLYRLEARVSSPRALLGLQAGVVFTGLLVILVQAH